MGGASPAVNGERLRSCEADKRRAAAGAHRPSRALLGPAGRWDRGCALDLETRHHQMHLIIALSISSIEIRDKRHSRDSTARLEVTAEPPRETSVALGQSRHSQRERDPHSSSPNCSYLSPLPTIRPQLCRVRCCSLYLRSGTATGSPDRSRQPTSFRELSASLPCGCLEPGACESTTTASVALRVLFLTAHSSS